MHEHNAHLGLALETGLIRSEYHVLRVVSLY
jgi:hypothetical protein